MNDMINHGLSLDDFQTFLAAGRWSATADDNIEGENVPADAVKRIVQNYAADPTGHATNRGLGLLALMLGVAEWGVEGHGLPVDPNGKNWKSNAGKETGKHLMSYAIGGVGISHSDVGDLEEFVKWVAGSGIVPAAQDAVFLSLTKTKYIYTEKGIQYDEVRAAGLCGQQVAQAEQGKDLLGEPFQHFKGSVDCSKWRNDHLNANDWRVFCTWIRIALRTKDAQAYLLRLWFDKYWDKTLSAVPAGEDFAEEAMINVRIRNSAPKTANEAIQHAAGRHDTAQKIQAQLDQYHEAKPDAAKRRWGIMMRPIVLYRHYLNKSPLVGVGLH